jgi:hypothetical protein
MPRAGTELSGTFRKKQKTSANRGFGATAWLYSRFSRKVVQLRATEVVRHLRLGCTTLARRRVNTDIAALNQTWSGKRDSNSRPRPWQGRALPTELFPLGIAHITDCPASVNPRGAGAGAAASAARGGSATRHARTRSPTRSSAPPRRPAASPRRERVEGPPDRAGRAARRSQRSAMPS